MGSVITLDIGELTLDWGKNESFRNYSKLFLRSDKKNIAYHYADDIVIYKSGYSSSLKRVKNRLELLGYSLQELKNFIEGEDFKYLSQVEIEINFEIIIEIFSKISIQDFKNENRNLKLGDYIVDNIYHNEKFKNIKGLIVDEANDISEYFESLDPYFVIRLLMENPNNLEMNLEWRVQDIIDGEWVDETRIYTCVDESDKFLIVTEGSSDTFIIKKAFEILRPEILDFFTFVDMEDNYPFTGTGNLYKFCQGLTSIRIQNKTIVLFDNDLEGVEKFNKTKKLNLPKQMKIMKLPELDEFNSFLTIGPAGESNENINGKAVSIECFLDLTKSKPKIRWTNYSKEDNAYQGSLVSKDTYVRNFKKVRRATENYEFTKLTILLDEIYKHCI